MNLAKRQALAQIFTEVLVVADVTVYNDNAIAANSTDPSTVYQFMAIFFGHVLNGVNLVFSWVVKFSKYRSLYGLLYLLKVNLRFINSFGNDPDINIVVKLKNLLFLSVCSIILRIQLNLTSRFKMFTFNLLSSLISNRLQPVGAIRQLLAMQAIQLSMVDQSLLPRQLWMLLLATWTLNRFLSLMITLLVGLGKSWNRYK